MALTNQTYLLLYTPLLVIVCLLQVNTCRQGLRTLAVRQFALFCLCLSGWLICEMLYHIVQNTFALRYLFDLKLVFAAFLVVALFFSLAGFYRWNRLFPRWLPYVLCIIPSITALLVLTGPWHPLVLKSFEIVSLSPLTYAINELGPWFYVHIFYSQGLAAAILVILLWHYSNLPRAYRGGSLLMLLGMLSYIIFSSVGQYGLQHNTLDYNLIGMCIGGVFFYLASLAQGHLDYLHIEQREAFDYLDEAIFILGQTGCIVDLNQPAKMLLKNLGCDYRKSRLVDLLGQLEAEGRVLRQPAEGQVGEDLYIRTGQFQLVYEMCWQEVSNPQIQEHGVFVVLTDVTNNRLSMERLREIAGLDKLTGLSNRYGYLELLRALDKPESLPLSVIIGDVDSLKQVNDLHGHAAGDALLHAVADVLVAGCPLQGQAARIGGDEFAMLLPQHTEAQAQAVIRAVQAQMKKIIIAGQPVSIAFGAATKKMPGENLNLLVHEADLNMYREKKNHDSKRRLG